MTKEIENKKIKGEDKYMLDEEIRQILINYYNEINTKHSISQSQINAFRVGLKYK